MVASRLTKSSAMPTAGLKQPPEMGPTAPAPASTVKETASPKYEFGSRAFFSAAAFCCTSTSAKV